MARARLKLMEHLGLEQLKERARVCKGADAKEIRRWQALKAVAEGESAQEAARACGLSKSWVSELVGRYNKDGPEAVADGRAEHSGGPKPMLDAERQKELLKALKAPVPAELGGGLW